ncbi:hypothetical protein CFIO01_10483 [Colletotrichum fioriniae PJ7]|uniref:Uncharacterized protein n=1 Tax=Colletotrichum fioriniae PJ7 TaxID=1445577 RepID=A0A010QLU9_9PEZI|nr:hypothetical protein CFIO01_10483 [Colletotrichum fioriniae PJ7]
MVHQLRPAAAKIWPLKTRVFVLHSNNPRKMQNDSILVTSETKTFRSSEEQTTDHEPGRQLTKLGPGVANSIFDSDGRSWRRRKFSLLHVGAHVPHVLAQLATAADGRWLMDRGPLPPV